MAPTMPKLPVDLVEHADGCTCPRCHGLEQCPSCGRQKLDFDWCFAEKRLVFAPWARSWPLADAAKPTGSAA